MLLSLVMDTSDLPLDSAITHVIDQLSSEWIVLANVDWHLISIQNVFV